jgi:CubicO group peptidase (beta-lactamase class C family)
MKSWPSPPRWGRPGSAQPVVAGRFGLASIATGEDTGNHIWWHNGATAGTHRYLAFMPAATVGVVVLSNTERPVEALGVR